jgi:hypothetical protein
MLGQQHHDTGGLWFEPAQDYQPDIRAQNQKQKEDMMGNERFQQPVAYGTSYDEMYGSAHAQPSTAYDNFSALEACIQQQQYFQAKLQNAGQSHFYQQGSSNQAVREPKGYDEMIMTGIHPREQEQNGRGGMESVGLQHDTHAHFAGEVTRRMGDVRLSQKFDEGRMGSAYGNQEYFSHQHAVSSMDGYARMMPSYIAAQPQQQLLPFHHMSAMPSRMQNSMGYDMGTEIYGDGHNPMAGMRFEGMHHAAKHMFVDGHNPMMAGLKYEGMQQAAMQQAAQKPGWNKYCHFCQHIKVFFPSSRCHELMHRKI